MLTLAPREKGAETAFTSMPSSHRPSLVHWLEAYVVSCLPVLLCCVLAALCVAGSAAAWDRNFHDAVAMFFNNDISLLSTESVEVRMAANRSLQASMGSGSLLTTAAEEPRVDDAQFAAFSRPPGNNRVRNIMVHCVVVAVCAFASILLLIGMNMDRAEQKNRLARALVPQESVPCGIAEQYYIDERLLAMRTPMDHVERRQPMNFLSYVLRYASCFGEVLSRQHIFLSFFVRAIPTFTRVKRGLLIILQLHLCLLIAAVVLNVLEHQSPTGWRYAVVVCNGAKDCIATLPAGLISAAVLCIVFRYAFYQPMRLTCYTSQSHPSSSPFPLHVHKFASIKSATLCESILCMRNGYERLQAHVLMKRSLYQRAVQAVWQTTQPSVKDLRFYGVPASCVFLLLVIGIIFGTLCYVLMLTAYLKDEVVYHWLAWSLTTFFVCTFFFEPALIFCVEVLWAACVAALAQRSGFGASSLSSTSRYREVVKQVESQWLDELRHVAARRIQRRWLAVLDMYRAIHEQTSAAIKIQAIRKKMVHQKRYVKERKWCLRVEILGCSDLDDASQIRAEQQISPYVTLLCDTGNPTLLTTKVAWDSGRQATFGETFFVDVKESSSMYVAVWSKGLNIEEFVGRGFFDFQRLKNSDKGKAGGMPVNVSLYEMQHGETMTKQSRQCGRVHLNVRFLDPLKDKCGEDGDELAWMLPKHRMQFALSKMGGKAKVGKMLGSLSGKVDSTTETVSVASSRPGTGAVAVTVTSTAPVPSTTVASSGRPPLVGVASPPVSPRASAGDRSGASSYNGAESVDRRSSGGTIGQTSSRGRTQQASVPAVALTSMPSTIGVPPGGLPPSGPVQSARGPPPGAPPIEPPSAIRSLSSTSQAVDIALTSNAPRSGRDGGLETLPSAVPESDSGGGT
eukprot:TRINITY_DN50243_c0_g1_i1.p1 TRINITY_DN50243_c0_g1~~TRINITY_DN50243_c0_g1_i1.p1  ORF type:complete len:987 (+),score=136.31 TRINITY_DN50243_c0_g1_i1:240-2963(+)